MFDIFVWSSGFIEYSNQRIQLIKPNDVWLRLTKIQPENLLIRFNWIFQLPFIHLILALSLPLPLPFLQIFACALRHIVYHLADLCNLIIFENAKHYSQLNFHYTYEVTMLSLVRNRPNKDDDEEENRKIKQRGARVYNYHKHFVEPL